MFRKHKEALLAYVCLWFFLSLIFTVVCGVFWLCDYPLYLVPRGSIRGDKVYMVNVWWDILVLPGYILAGLRIMSIGKDGVWYSDITAVIGLMVCGISGLALIVGGTQFSLVIFGMFLPILLFSLIVHWTLSLRAQRALKISS